jgi:hypothetical protein
MGRILWIVLIPFLVLSADPIDTALDFLDALERSDGASVMRLLSSDISQRFGEVFDQLVLLASENPAMLSAALSRFGGRVTPDDILLLSHEDLVGRLLEGRSFPRQHDLEREHAVLEGRNAMVVLDFAGGGSVSFQMVWEDGAWKITYTSLLAAIL